MADNYQPSNNNNQPAPKPYQPQRSPSTPPQPSRPQAQPQPQQVRPQQSFQQQVRQFQQQPQRPTYSPPPNLPKEPESVKQQPVQSQPQPLQMRRPEPTFSMNDIAQKRSGVGKIFSVIAGLLGVVVVVALIAGGAALAGRVWDPFWNPFRPNPDKFISAALLKTKDIKTYHSNSTVKISYQGSQGSANFTGDADVSDLQNAKMQGEVNVLATNIPPVNASFNLKIGLKLIGKDVYFNLEDFDQSFAIFFSGFISAYPNVPKTDLNNIKGVWVKYTIPQNTGQNSTNASSLFFNELAKYKIYDFQSKLPDTTIDGQKVYQYSVVINKQNLEKLISDLITQQVKQMSTQAQQGNSVDVSSFAAGFVQGMMQQFLDKIGDIKVNLAIGSKDNYIYGTEINKEIDLGQFLGRADSEKLGIIIDTNNSSINQSVSIQPPDNYKDFKQAFPEIINSAIKNNMATLKAVADRSKFDKGDYSEFSCQNDFAKTACNNIKLSSGADVQIHLTKKYYCAFASLITAPGEKQKYYCIDALGKNHETTINPASAGYCTGKTIRCP